ncbi:MAG: sigma-70 family RNA polymerase sigma factor [Saprospiraceae bacterium]|nr:sigma-70 family RNA polymerase sigma factor [Saprospiraceae bacterium]
MIKDWHDILEACKHGDRIAQKQFYERFKDKMFVLCLRYANSREDAEDLLQEGFITVFRDLHQYKGVGNLEGWVRKVILNIALQYIRRQKHLFQMIELEDVAHRLQSEHDFIEEDTTRNLIRIMQQLPPGFRTVLNLYVLEDYSHEQIAKELGISVGTSKSQLNRAKCVMRALVEKSLTE